MTTNINPYQQTMGQPFMMNPIMAQPQPQKSATEVNAVKIELNEPKAYNGAPTDTSCQMAPSYYSYPQTSLYGSNGMMYPYATQPQFPMTPQFMTYPTVPQVVTPQQMTQVPPSAVMPQPQVQQMPYNQQTVIPQPQAQQMPYNQQTVIPQPQVQQMPYEQQTVMPQPQVQQMPYEQQTVMPQPQVQQMPYDQQTVMPQPQVQQMPYDQQTVMPQPQEQMPQVPPAVVETPEQPSASPVQPSVEQPKSGTDVNQIVQDLNSPDLETQFNTINKIAETVQSQSPEAENLLAVDTFKGLASVVNKDTTGLEGPTQEQTALREKALKLDEINKKNEEGIALTAEEQELMKNPLTPEELTISEQLSPQEVAEMNKQYALYTLAILQNSYRDAVSKDLEAQGMPPAKINELPEINLVIDSIKSNPSSLVREAGISALSYVARPEDKDVVKNIFTLATQDADEGVRNAAAKALTAIGEPVPAAESTETEKTPEKKETRKERKAREKAEKEAAKQQAENVKQNAEPTEEAKAA